jgi:uncharacterized membrane protein YgdD (TMEM256/DUF423 family)
MTGGVIPTDAFARRCAVAGALFMLASLVLGALGTHVVASRVPAGVYSSYETAVLYQSLHALGLILVAVLARTTGVTGWLRGSAALMALGMVLFSGTIYLVTAGASRELLAAAPGGGMALMASWASLAVHAAKAGRR